ncbi:MAG: alanyl-tRNA editing protein [Spirochaetes bacterium]|nr:MAG: alanyl-tRNA editing protein [Spirochaetota bacterium]
MTDLLFQRDSYIKVFDAEIGSVDEQGASVVLDRTAFYPGGGGQPCDTGLILMGDREFPVVGLKKNKKGELHHYIEEEAFDPEALKTGVKVKGMLDWDKRYKLMRTHTAMHILCGVIWRDYNAKVTGGKMSPLKGRMDFEFETLKQEMIREIEDKINTEVERKREVRIKTLSIEEAFKIPDIIRTRINLLPSDIKEIRTIEITGLDLQADGGTHVSNTGEVGHVKIVNYKSKGKINKRIEIALK